MARYLGPKAKLSRREGTDLFLKSARRSIGDKAKFDTKPGQHGRTSRLAHHRLRPAAAREAEGQAHVRRARAPVPPLLRRSRAPQGQHRREPADRCSNRAWTTSSTAWASARPAPKRASWCRTRRITVNGEVGQHRRRTWSRPATWSPCARRPRSSCASPTRCKLAESDRPAGLGAGRRHQAGRHLQEGAGPRRVRRRHQGSADRRVVLALIGLTRVAAAAPRVISRCFACRARSEQFHARHCPSALSV